MPLAVRRIPSGVLCPGTGDWSDCAQLARTHTGGMFVQDTRRSSMGATNEPTGKRTRAVVVLVVEDDADLREIVSATLAGAGYTVAEAADGAEALKYLVSAGAPEPHVIVLDVQMPNMSGPELIKVIKSYHRLKQIPVILTSARVRRAEIDVEAAWLPKPFEAARLLELVRELCATGSRAGNPLG